MGKIKPNLKYIQDNIHLLDIYKLNDIETDLRREKMSTELGLHVDSSDRVAGIYVDLFAKNALSTVRSELTKRYGSVDAYKAYAGAGGVVSSGYMRWVQDDTYALNTSYGIFPLRELLVFLDYLVDGTVHDDYASVNGVIDAKGWRDFTRDAAFTIEYRDIGVRRYKNGRLDLKFPTRESADACRALVAKWERYRCIRG